jgi:hypothetical protein
VVDTWLEVEAQQFHPPASHILRHCVILPMTGGARVVDENVERLRAVLDVYDARLRDRARRVRADADGHGVCGAGGGEGECECVVGARQGAAGGREGRRARGRRGWAGSVHVLWLTDLSGWGW